MPARGRGAREAYNLPIIALHIVHKHMHLHAYTLYRDIAYSDADARRARRRRREPPWCPGPYAVNGKVTPLSVTVSESPYIDGWRQHRRAAERPRDADGEHKQNGKCTLSHVTVTPHIYEIRVPRTSSDPE